MRFASRAGLSCEIGLTRRAEEGRDYDVVLFRIPGLPRPKWLSATDRRHEQLAGSRATQLTPEAVNNFLDMSHDLLIDRLLDENYGDRVWARVRTGLTPANLHAAKSARAFLRGEISGRAFRIELVSPAHELYQTQTQVLFLVQTSQTPHHAILFSADGISPTWDNLQNLNWPHENIAPGVLHAVRLEEAADHPAQFHRVEIVKDTPMYRPESAFTLTIL